MNFFSAALLMALLFSPVFGAGGRCGTANFMQELKSPQKKKLAKEYSADAAAVMEKRTSRFIIFYMADGANAAKPAFIDSMAKYLEQAYDLHKNVLGMRSISGAARTYFYDKVAPSGLYPVEVIDTGAEADYCGTYGLTFPPSSRAPRATQIAIENDFIYGTDCPDVRKRKGDPFTSSINGDYSKKWDLALKVTVFHELYHSFQMAQFDFVNNDNDTFWLEASATGVEEMGAPEVNDYIDYIPSVFSNPGKSMQDIDRQSGEAYGYATLYLFLSSELGKKFDSFIWDYFSKYPEEAFEVQLARHVSSQGGGSGDAEALFHKYATHVFYSGSRASQSPHGLFWEDMPEWPNWRMKTSGPPYLRAGTFDFVRTPSGAAPGTDSARITPLAFGKNGDSTVWVLSRLLEKDFVPPPAAVPLKGFAAFPNPWNPKRHEKVKFGPMPKNSSGVEIRSANGALLERIAGGEAGDTLIWQPKKIPAPGILYYRTLPYEKNKMLLVEH